MSETNLLPCPSDHTDAARPFKVTEDARDGQNIVYCGCGFAAFKEQWQRRAPHGVGEAAPVAWMDATDPERPQTIPVWAKDSDAFGKVVDRAYTIPLYTHPAPSVGEAALREALEGMLAIVGDSHGVAGYHTNGDVAEWDEFPEVAAARAALSAPSTGSDKEATDAEAF